MADTPRERVFLITGATGALGSVVTREFARTGAYLALTGRSQEKLEQLIVETELQPECVFFATADVTHEDGATTLVEAAIARFGRIDVLLNTAGGYSGGKTVVETAVEE
jgi:NADP-dependent 3-hydroxy acid dehydrogenase YdfG